MSAATLVPAALVPLLTLDDQRLLAICERIAAATPGPWEWTETPIGEGASLRSTAPVVNDGSVGGWERAHIIDDGSAGGEYGSWLKAPDAELIAHAPDDLLWLVEYISRLRTLRDSLTAERDQWRAAAQSTLAKLDDAIVAARFALTPAGRDALETVPTDSEGAE